MVNVKPPRPDKPLFTVLHPTCTVATGTVTLTNKSAEASYLLRQNGSVKYTVAGNIFEGVAAGNYEIIAVQGICDHADSLNIQAQPFIPKKPIFTITHPTCTNSKGYLTVSNMENGVSYTLAQYGQSVYTADTYGVFGNITPGKYMLIAQAAICDKADSALINEQPPTPTAPSLFVTPPSFCSATGSVRITNPSDSNLLFSKDGGATWQAARDFGGLAAGAGSAWEFKVKNTYGCISGGATVCEGGAVQAISEVTATAMRSGISEEQGTVSNNEEPASNSARSRLLNDESAAKYLGAAQLTDPTVTIRPIPNPFGSKVRFLINSPETAKGILEIYNMQGQKIKTVFQGYINEGLNYFDLTLPQSNRSELIYILRMADKNITGKILQLANFKQ